MMNPKDVVVVLRNFLSGTDIEIRGEEENFYTEVPYRAKYSNRKGNYTLDFSENRLLIWVDKSLAVADLKRITKATIQEGRVVIISEERFDRETHNRYLQIEGTYLGLATTFQLCLVQAEQPYILYFG